MGHPPSPLTLCEGGRFRTRLNHDCHDVGMIAMIPTRAPLDSGLCVNGVKHPPLTSLRLFAPPYASEGGVHLSPFAFSPCHSERSEESPGAGGDHGSHSHIMAITVQVFRFSEKCAISV